MSPVLYSSYSKVVRFINNLIEVTIITGKFKGTDVLLPHIPMTTLEMPFNFKSLQLTIHLAFAKRINKAQGQSLQFCELNLENPGFSLGQLYVACSQVGKPTDLYVYAPQGKTKKYYVSQGIRIRIIYLRKRKVNI